MLPKKWYIKGSTKLGNWICKKERELGISIRIAGTQNHWFYWPTNINLSSWDGTELEKPKGKEISFEEFEKYVLNKMPEIKEDMSYLIKLLKKCNIK